MSQFSIVMVKSPDGPSSTRSVGTDASAHRLTLVGNTLGFGKPGFELLAKIEQRETERIWLEPCDRPGQNRSFVVIFGWCYRRTSDAPLLSDGDCSAILESHRQHEIIDLDDFSGNYCLLSYDHLTDTLWCCSDLWAQQSFYFGANSALVAIGSRASQVADRMRAPVDGNSYMTILRGASILPGRSMYSGVCRAVCGLGLKADLRTRTAEMVRVGEIWKPVLSIPFTEAVQLAADAVTRVVLRASSLPHTAVDLTGGNDTRLTAAALSSPAGAEFGRRVTFKTIADADHPDAVVAGRIADEFKWAWRRLDRTTYLVDDAVGSLREAAVLSDGQHLPCVLARAVVGQKTDWVEFPFLVGSIGGEFFRDLFWYQETLNMGRGERVNYDAFMRTWAKSSDIDFRRISRGAVSERDHDDHLRAGYSSLEAGAPAMLNVYKLDRIAMYRVMSNSGCWEYSAFRTTLLPYHTAESTDVCFRIPWRYRFLRRLTTGIVERLQPRLATIPTDRGAPMRPLRIGNVGSYLRFHVWDVSERLRHHFGAARRRANDASPGRNLPRAWFDYAKTSAEIAGMYDIAPVMEKAEDSMPEMEAAGFRELQMLVLLAMLKEVYPNLQLRLDFDHPDPLVPNKGIQL